jgi:hypothetical protein
MAISLQFMKRKKWSKSPWVKVYVHIGTVLFLIPYLYIFTLDNSWRGRWFFGLVSWVILPIMLLWGALDPIATMPGFNPDKLSKKRLPRYFRLFFRLLFFAGGIWWLLTMTIPYCRGSIQIAANGWQPERITGDVVRDPAGQPYGKALMILMYFRLQDSDRKFKLPYPFGKRALVGSRYELLIVPGTDFVVDLKEIPSG